MAPDIPCLRRDGTIIYADINTISTVLDGRECNIGFFTDVTAQRQMEAELQKAHRLESVGVLAGGIAHDFNNILTSPMGEMQLLMRYNNLPDDVREGIRTAFEGLKRTKDLTGQLLTFAKGGAPVKETASIEEIIEGTTELSLRGSNTRPEYSLAEDLSAVDVDRGQISQVIQNLVINARQAMAHGGVLRISAQNVELEQETPLALAQGRYVKISVADRGVGIPEGSLENIFEPFFTTKQQGSGLGLAISYKIIADHGGRITADSTLGVGTTFDIYLPASRKEAVAVAQERQEVPGGTGRILLMDDQEGIHRTVGRMLTELGYEVDSVYDGAQAIEAYRKSMETRPYAAVIMDLTIPGGMGGKEAITHILDVDPGAKVIVSSGYATDPVMARYQQYGFAGVVKKPVDMDELADKLHSVLAGSV